MAAKLRPSETCNCAAMVFMSSSAYAWVAFDDLVAIPTVADIHPLEGAMYDSMSQMARAMRRSTSHRLGRCLRSDGRATAVVSPLPCCATDSDRACTPVLKALKRAPAALPSPPE